MKIVNFGSTYKIYGEDLRTYDKLPPATYKVGFHPMQGFYLEKVSDFKSTEEKVYGAHAEKIKKVLSSYQKFDRSMGVLLSGNKGMGKSMFVQLIGESATEILGIPVILVKQAFVGIADFIEEIEQEALIVFDEFEKMFHSDRHPFGRQQEKPASIESQDNLLSLFDGISTQKRLYAITVNDLGRVNEFMLSRPGRFHYHIRFDYPTHEQIEEYLKDKVEEQYYGEIKHVISFSNRVKLNYDSLRAIAFELNEGYSFESSIGDLNILTSEAQRFDIKVLFADGKGMEIKGEQLNLFADSIRLTRWHNGIQHSFVFNPLNIVEELMQMVVPGEFVEVEAHDEDDDEVKATEVKAIFIKKEKEAGVNYRLTV